MHHAFVIPVRKRFVECFFLKYYAYCTVILRLGECVEEAAGRANVDIKNDYPTESSFTEMFFAIHSRQKRDASSVDDTSQVINHFISSSLQTYCYRRRP